MKQLRDYHKAVLMNIAAIIGIVVGILSIPWLIYTYFSEIGVIIAGITYLAVIALYYLFLGARSFYYYIALELLRKDVRQIPIKLRYVDYPLYQEYIDLERGMVASYLSNKDFFRVSFDRFQKLEDRRRKLDI